MAPSVDLVIVFRNDASKADAADALAEYTRLLTKLGAAGLRAAGKKGATRSQLIICVYCPPQTLGKLLERETSRDFVHGLTTTKQVNPESLPPAARLRLIYQYVTTAEADGGLGITAAGRVESVMALHDPEFNERWIRAWSSSLDISSQLDSLRAQFGESLALYFAFLSFYTRSLIFPAALGVLTFFFAGSFNATYSVILLLWSVVFVEWWRIKERAISVRWSVRGAAKVEMIRPEYVAEGDNWWKRELRVIASLPVIGLFATLLSALLTSLFIFEAFVTQLYKGPGSAHISLAPTVLFISLVPRLLAFYQKYAVRLTRWENHPRQSAYDRSLTLKTFVLAGMVAYGGLCLSAFVYVPFGAQFMRFIQSFLSETITDTAEGHGSKLFRVDHSGSDGERVIQGLKGDRLKNQVFAYLVTNQVINIVLEVIIPWATKVFNNFRARQSAASANGKKKTVEFADEKAASRMSNEDRAFLETIHTQVGLPEYQLFGDYSEMITQFGYVVLWSACWPLAPFMALLNNWLELRSDAFKVSTLGRRPIPSRTDTIGAWLESLSFITWFGALINAALVFLFNPENGTFASSTSKTLNYAEHTNSFTNATNAAAFPSSDEEPHIPFTTKSILHPSGTPVMLTALLIALASSHAYIFTRAIVRHILERALWRGSKEAAIVEHTEKEVKNAWLSEHMPSVTVEQLDVDGNGDGGSSTFWSDEGESLIQSATKSL